MVSIGAKCNFREGPMKLNALLLFAVTTVTIVGLSSPQLPKLYRYRDLKINNSKLTYCWAQEAIGVPEAHSLLTRFKNYTTTPSIGIFEAGYNIATLIKQTRLSAELIDYLSIPPTEPIKILQGDVWGSSPTKELVQDVHYINAVFTKMGLDKGQRDHLLLAYYLSAKKRSKEQHGTAVANLLTSKSPFGVSANGEIDFLFLSRDDKWEADNDLLEAQIWTGNAYRLGLVIDSLPDIVNISRKFDPLVRAFTPPEIQEQYTKIAQKTIVVASAGNVFPDPIESGKRELFDKMIIVGSTEPSGCVTLYSPSNDKVTICAPSGNRRVLQTTGEEDGSIAFGGTSGATPLVTGALADVLSFLPTLTVSEARQMLQKTAIISGDNTAVLNYYKLIRVAIKLSTIGWPEHRKFIFTDDFYDFTDESRQYLSIDNTSEEQTFANLRRAFFLSSNNSAIREKLSQIYAQAGYEAQALFYGNDSIPPRDTREHDYLTAIAEADGEKIAAILSATDDKDFYNKVFTSHLLKRMDKKDRQTVVKTLEEHEIEIRTQFHD